jgi:hypothetical protein
MSHTGLVVVPFRRPPPDAQPAAEQISSTRLACALLAFAEGGSSYLRFGLAFFSGAHVLRELGTAICVLLGSSLVYSLACLAWLSFLKRKNGQIAAVRADLADRNLHVLLTSSSLSHEAALEDQQMNALDFCVVDNAPARSPSLVLKVSPDQAETHDPAMTSAVDRTSTDESVSLSAGHDLVTWPHGPATPGQMSMRLDAVVCHVVFA